MYCKTESKWTFYKINPVTGAYAICKNGAEGVYGVSIRILVEIIVCLAYKIMAFTFSRSINLQNLSFESKVCSVSWEEGIYENLR